MFELIKQLKEWAVEQVLWAEKNLRGNSGAEKKAAVIKRLDDMITLPAYLEWADDIVIAWIIDAVCEKLNAVAGHDFGGKELNEKQVEEVAEGIEVPESVIHH